MPMNSATNLSCSDEDIRFVLTVALIVGGWSSIVTCVLGLLANTFSIIILAQQRMRSLSTNIYLIALAVVNFLWLVFFLIFYALRLTIILPSYISANDQQIFSVYNQMFHRLSPYIIPSMNTLQLCIIYYTVAVSVDRYLYISMGLNVSQYCTIRNALRIIFSLTIFAILFILPYWFKYRAVTYLDYQNRTHYEVSHTKLGQQKIFQQVINVYIYVPVVHVIPLITLLLINILTVRRLIQYHDEHRRLLCQSIRQMTMMQTKVLYSRRHFHVSIMLIAVVVLFLLCRLPMLMNNLYEVHNSTKNNRLTEDNLYFQCRILLTFNTFANFMQTINSNGNLIIYILCCQNFRETTREVFDKLMNFFRLQSNEGLLSMIHIRSRTSTRSTVT
ncbi:unnamed protein product [Adineta ricciae]|uniref:G-protein coupled receptors family 1 profile domain-containing protein n=1 Tax=Adineta ricciae TaxID=249248 RepID=A0A813WA33_ADIRI|nr:unnamed protein product [Adineta ricciae]CAF1293949.1 unnamed protein product [Adineta ricciae]